MVKMNLIDKAISFFSPEAGVKRAIARGKLRAYDAGTSGRRGDGWANHGASNHQNDDIQRYGTKVRQRSIDGYKNNSNVFGAIRVIQNNVAGTGIMPTPIAKPGDKALSNMELKKIKTNWELFVESCDWDEMFNFYGLQSLAMRNVPMQGEIFVVRQRDKNNSPVPFKLQILEPHMVDMQKSSYMLSNRPEGNYVMNGVEFDVRGRKVGYWMHEYNPNNPYTLKLAPVFVSKDDVIQVFYKEFPSQVRGMAWGTSAMLNMRDLSEYEDAALMAAKVAAAHAVFTTQEMPVDNVPTEANENDVDRPSHLEPGMITYLNPGEDVKFNTPPTPQSFSEYVGKNQQKNAKGYGITFEQFTGDMSNVNFSSGRMGWIEANRQVEDWQYNFFIQQFCKPIWNWFIEGLIINGIINREVWAEWTPQGREMLDPVKETNGVVLKLQAGLISWTEAIKQLGYNPDTILEQIKADKKLFEDAGITVEWIMQQQSEPEETEEQSPNQASQ